MPKRVMSVFTTQRLCPRSEFPFSSNRTQTARELNPVPLLLILIHKRLLFFVFEFFCNSSDAHSVLYVMNITHLDGYIVFSAYSDPPSFRRWNDRNVNLS